MSRKDEWEKYRASLSFSGRHPKSDLKMLENYFLKAKEPTGAYMGDPIPLVYRLWLAQDPSEAGWEAVYSSFMQLSLRSAKASLCESRSIFFEEAASGRYNGVDGAPLGFFSGQEERLFRFFCSRQLSDGTPLFGDYDVWGFRTYMELILWLNGDANANPFILYRYMMDFWFSSLESERYIKDCMTQVAIRKYMKDYFATVKRIAAEKASPVEGAVEYACEFARRIEGLTLKEPFAKLWASA
ncbi:hypothetical protein [Pseudomonas nicosulfuronedens]